MGGSESSSRTTEPAAPILPLRNRAARPRRPHRRRRRLSHRDEPGWGRHIGGRRDSTGAARVSRASAVGCARAGGRRVRHRRRDRRREPRPLHDVRGWLRLVDGARARRRLGSRRRRARDVALAAGDPGRAACGRGRVRLVRSRLGRLGRRSRMGPRASACWWPAPGSLSSCMRRSSSRTVELSLASPCRSSAAVIRRDGGRRAGPGALPRSVRCRRTAGTTAPTTASWSAPTRRVPEALEWVDLRFALALAVVVRLSFGGSRPRARPARRLLAPVLVAGIAVTAIHAAHAAAAPADAARGSARARPSPRSSPASVSRLWAPRARFGWDLVRARRARRPSSVSSSSWRKPPSRARSRRRSPGPPATRQLRIAYQAARRGALRRRSGRLVPEPVASTTRAVTPIVRDGRPSRVPRTRPHAARRLLPRPDRLGGATCGRERAAPGGGARAVDRASRIAGADRRDERRRAPAARARPARRRAAAADRALLRPEARAGEAGPDPDPARREPLADAERALDEALGAVRVVANGLFPATLASSGLAYAVEELAELAPIRIDIGRFPTTSRRPRSRRPRTA